MGSPKTSQQQFRVGAWRADPNSLAIQRNGQVCHLEPRAFAVLRYLADRPRQVVSVDELMDALWPGVVVTPNAVSRVIANLRKALGDDARKPEYIETIARTGYRMVAETEPAVVSASPRFAYLGLAALALVTIVAVVWLYQFNNGPAPKPSVAVLPFENLTGDAALDYLGDGVAEEIIHSLAQHADLSVSARMASFRFRDMSQSPQQIARQLGVHYLVEGSVRRDGPKLRITAQLIDSNKRFQVSSDTVEAELNQVFQAQDSVSAVVVRALSRELDLALKPTPARAGPDPEAYALYLQARHLWHRRATEPIEPVIELLTEAVRIDPDFARAWSALGSAYITYPSYSEKGFDVYENGEAAATRAIELSPELGEPYAVLASYAHARLQWPEGERLYREAIQRERNNPYIHQWFGEHLVRAGRFAEGILQFERALELDPLYPIARHELAITYMLQGDYEHGRSIVSEMWRQGVTSRSTWAGNFVSSVLLSDYPAAHGWIDEPGRPALDPALMHRFVDVEAGQPDQQLAQEILDSEQIPLWLKVWTVARLGAYKALLDTLVATTDEYFDAQWLWGPGTDFRKQPQFQEIIQLIRLDQYWRQGPVADLCRESGDQFVCDKMLATTR
ncbi:MAG: hypothetical protein HKN49_00900 [Gammaproteobacteria bacterium]|nr:hypothetical protein [Gammaproteobacteria bacterium]